MVEQKELKEDGAAPSPRQGRPGAWEQSQCGAAAWARGGRARSRHLTSTKLRALQEPGYYGVVGGGGGEASSVPAFISRTRRMNEALRAAGTGQGPTAARPEEPA